MARTTQEVFDSLLVEKANYPELNELDSTGATAIWRLWLWIVAFATSVHEQLWDEKAVELEELATQAVYGTPQWWRGRMFDYQDGYPLLVNSENYQPFYDVEDDSAKIIKYAAVQQVGQVGVIKVARDSSGTPLPLSTLELDRVRGYILDIKPVGTAIAVESRSSDKLITELEIYYDANLVKATVESAVKAAVKAYLTALPFDGAVVRSAVVDAVQAVEGVLDVVVTSMSGQETGGSPTPFARQYSTRAGHIVLDEVNSVFNLTGE